MVKSKKEAKRKESYCSLLNILQEGNNLNCCLNMPVACTFPSSKCMHNMRIYTYTPPFQNHIIYYVHTLTQEQHAHTLAQTIKGTHRVACTHAHTHMHAHTHTHTHTHISLSIIMHHITATSVLSAWMLIHHHFWSACVCELS